MHLRATAPSAIVTQIQLQLAQASTHHRTVPSVPKTFSSVRSVGECSPESPDMTPAGALRTRSGHRESLDDASLLSNLRVLRLFIAQICGKTACDFTECVFSFSKACQAVSLVRMSRGEKSKEFGQTGGCSNQGLLIHVELPAGVNGPGGKYGHGGWAGTLVTTTDG